jgi:hypothetical protein
MSGMLQRWDPSGCTMMNLQQHEEEGGQSSLHLKLILAIFSKRSTSWVTDHHRSHGNFSRMPQPAATL